MSTHTGGYRAPIDNACVDDLVVLVEWYVSTQHVIQQDAQRPDGRRFRVVLAVADPLRRTIDPRACIQQNTAIITHYLQQSLPSLQCDDCWNQKLASLAKRDPVVSRPVMASLHIWWQKKFKVTSGNACLRTIIVFGLVMTLTFDLWPWKPFQQCPLTWWIFVPSLIKTPLLRTKISRHSK